MGVSDSDRERIIKLRLRQILSTLETYKLMADDLRRQVIDADVEAMYQMCRDDLHADLMSWQTALQAAGYGIFKIG